MLLILLSKKELSYQFAAPSASPNICRTTSPDPFCIHNRIPFPVTFMQLLTSYQNCKVIQPRVTSIYADCRCIPIQSRRPTSPRQYRSFLLFLCTVHQTATLSSLLLNLLLRHLSFLSILSFLSLLHFCKTQELARSRLIQSLILLLQPRPLHIPLVSLTIPTLRTRRIGSPSLRWGCEFFSLGVAATVRDLDV